MYDILDMQPMDYDGVYDPSGFDPATLAEHGADQHFAVLDRELCIRARCSVWWRKTARVDRRPIGAIGHYFADGSESAALLLRHACREIGRRGAVLAVGPLDGSTWRRYRFITERGAARPFFLEPDNPDDFPMHFIASGFSSYAHYVSALNPDIATRQLELGDLRAKFADLGVTVEALDLDGTGDPLDGIYRVACEAFADALLFTPIGFDEFVRMYGAMIAGIDPRLVLIARHAGRIVGFVFCPPDLLGARDPAEIDTIVIKTVAVLPRTEYRGLGRLMIVEALTNAVDCGYRRAINALMHRTNRSCGISGECAQPMRAYQLFAREVTP